MDYQRTTKGEESDGNPNTDSAPIRFWRAKDSTAARVVRGRVGRGESGAGERNQRIVVAGFGTATANRKRRAGWRSSRPTLGVDNHRPVSPWRCQATSHVPAF